MVNEQCDFKHIPATGHALSRRRLVYGVGVNDAPYATQPVIDGVAMKCPYYATWVGMLLRCYSKSYHKKKPTYADCTVSVEWFSFMNFRGWMAGQKWKGLHLDKDVLIQGNKIYGPESCVFISSHINTLLCENGKSRGDYPQGVCKESAGFTARCSVKGKKKYIGTFSTPEGASSAYREFKSSYIRFLATKESDAVKSALYKYAGNL